MEDFNDSPTGVDANASNSTPPPTDPVTPSVSPTPTNTPPAPQSGQDDIENPSSGEFDVSSMYRQTDNEEEDASLSDSEDIDTDDLKAVNAAVAPHLKKAAERQLQIEAKLDVQDFLSKPGNAEFAEFKDQVTKIISDPKNPFTAEAVFYAVAGMSGKFRQILMNQSKQTDQAAASASSASNAPRPSDAPQVNFATMSDEEFRKYEADVAAGYKKLPPL